MTSKPSKYLIASICLGLAACAATDDPRQGGFVSGIEALRTGAYDRRIEERKAQLSELERLQAALERRAGEAQADAQASSDEVARLSRELADIRAQNTQAAERLAALKRVSKLSEAVLAGLLEEQRAIEAVMVTLVVRQQSQGTDAQPTAASLQAQNLREAGELKARQERFNKLLDSYGE